MSTRCLNYNNSSQLRSRPLSPVCPNEAKSAIIGRPMPTPIGHAMAGVAAAWIADLIPGDRAWRIAPPFASWYQRAGGALTAGCAALAVLADIDLAWLPLSPRSHRTITHSIGAVLLVGLAAAVLQKKVSDTVGLG